MACIKEVATTVFRDLNDPLAAHKMEDPFTQVTFLGFVLDTEVFQVRLPQEKLDQMRELVHGCCMRWNFTWEELVPLL